ncbi:HD domain-containing protein [Nocardiopsis kunsanensis]|uniref:HD domain-containing protein n=1 Tax=Nocardiopsis kunsanensis TaxID=141693 RepID=UPI00034A85A0|nr:hypothetical protein [Nocardiopsis kunsanensis]
MVSSHGSHGADDFAENEKMGLLRASWFDLAGTTPEARAACEELLGRWSEPHRRYYTLTHLWQTLDAVEEIGHEAEDIALVRYAMWFHGAVHDGRAGTDEQESAVVAERLLSLVGHSRERIDEIVRLVGLIAPHRPGEDDPDGAVVCDADLSILAADPENYLEYIAAVRAEYAYLPDQTFRTARLRLLEALLERPHLFHTRFGRTHWEGSARANMRAEADRLSGDARPKY